MRTIMFLFCIVFSMSIDAQRQQTLFDQLVYVNEQWLNQPDVDSALRTTPARLMNETQLLQFHLDQTRKLLMRRAVDDLPEILQQQRKKHLNTLENYTEAGVFPVNDAHMQRQPYFIDKLDTYCAVGFLMKESGADDIAKSINQTQNYSYLFDIYHPQLMEWVSTSGLTLSELALIQPDYPGTWPSAVMELHYNNTGADVNEYIEVHQSSMQTAGAPPFNKIKFYNSSNVLYKTLLISEMTAIQFNQAFHYSFPSNENFADQGIIEIIGGYNINDNQLLSRYIYNASSVIIDDYHLNTNRTYNVGESESTPVGMSLTFCGHYISTPAWNLQLLPITTGSVNACTIMPLNLAEFYGTVKANTVELNWRTSQEFNAKHFVVERSIDGNSFEEVGKVSASGFSSTSKKYSFIDKAPKFNNHYRLKQVDADNKFSYSKIVFIKVANAAVLKVLENPVYRSLRINITAGAGSIRSLVVYDLYGRKAKDYTLTNQATELDISLLPDGKYFLQLVTTGNQVFYQSFVKITK